jgi:hypothetical protein
MANPAPSPILVTIPHAASMLARSRGFIYQAISTGKISAVKSDGRTLVTVESLRAYVANLPQAKIKPMTRRAPERLRTILTPATVAAPRVRKPKRERLQLETNSVA